MRLSEPVSLIICFLAIIGLYTLVCMLVRAFSRRDRLTVGVRVPCDVTSEDLHQMLANARASIGASVGLDPTPVILVDGDSAASLVRSGLYIEFGDVDIYVKMTIPREVP